MPEAMPALREFFSQNPDALLVLPWILLSAALQMLTAVAAALAHSHSLSQWLHQHAIQATCLCFASLVLRTPKTIAVQVGTQQRTRVLRGHPVGPCHKDTRRGLL